MKKSEAKRILDYLANLPDSDYADMMERAKIMKILEEEIKE